MADDQDPATTPEAGQAPPPDPDTPDEGAAPAPAVKKTTRRSPRKSTAKKTAPSAEAEAVAPGTSGTPGEADPDVAPEGETAPARRTTAKKAPAKKAAAKKATPAKKAAAKKAPAKRTTKKVAAAPVEETPAAEGIEVTEPAETTAPETEAPAAVTVPLFQAPVTAAPVKRPRKRTTTTVAGASAPAQAPAEETTPAAVEAELATDAPVTEPEEAPAAETAPVEDAAPEAAPEEAVAEEAASGDSGTDGSPDPGDTEDSSADDSDSEGDGGGRRRRRRGGRRRRKGSGGGQNQDDDQGETSGGGQDDQAQQTPDATGSDDDGAEGSGSRGGNRSRKAAARSEDAGTESSSDAASAEAGPGAERDSGDGSEGNDGEQGGTSRRRRRRRREGDDGGQGNGDPSNTVTRVRKQRSAEDEITAVAGSTRLEAKKQRRREGREAGRRRAPIVSEAEFLARREAVERTMVIRQREELTQIAVLEDKVLVEHYVARESQTSLIGNVYVGRVQNVLPSMEAAFIDIGKGRNAVLYAGEVNWQALGHKDGAPRKIESVLSSGQPILVQVTKDPVGHKGARLTSQVSLAGRFLVYVPDGTTNGISRKLADTERTRLKSLLKEIVPDSAGVIVRTAAEGASEDELTRDVERLKARWEDIEAKVSTGNAPQLLYGEPDLTLKVVRDLFTEDFTSLVIQGEDAWDTVQGYVSHVAPDLEERLQRDESDLDVFTTYRVDEQIAKGLDRKVFLPSGGSLVIDRTEAMTVVDVNTGKFTGSGGNLEETVTKNNLEAAEEIVRQLRLRDIGGIIVVDFIDMVLESNRDLVLRRLVECLGRDRTRHQVAEVTSLGLVQMTRKRIGTGLVEAFSHACEACQGRGVMIQERPVEPRHGDDEPRGKGGRRNRGGRGGQDDAAQGKQDKQDGSERGGRQGGRGRGGQDRDQARDHAEPATEGGGRAPTPAEFAAMARADRSAESAESTESAEQDSSDPTAGGDETTPVVTDPAVAPGETPAPDAPVVEPTSEDPAGTGEAPAAAEPVVETAPEQTAEAVTDPVVETASEDTTEQAPAAQQPAEPAAEVAQAPRVVTRTRRRSATRPAGEPVGAAAPAPIVVGAAPAPAEEAPEAPAAPGAGPRVVTRTRGRGGRRATGASGTTPDQADQADQTDQADQGASE